MLKCVPLNICGMKDWLTWIFLVPSYFSAIINQTPLEGRLILLDHGVTIKRFLLLSVMSRWMVGHYSNC